MEPFQTLTALVAPLDRANVDTDAIIPKQFLTSIKRTGFGPNLFDELRYLDYGEPGKDNDARPKNPDFVLNQPRYAQAQILLARRNFGCGSSREHAPWALADYGFRVLIAPSFADIFYNNSFKNGILLVTLPESQLDTLFGETIANPGYELTVSLEDQTVVTPSGQVFPFEVDRFKRETLLEGLDEIGLTLQRSEEIRAYERRRKTETPWLFDR